MVDFFLRCGISLRELSHDVHVRNPNRKLIEIAMSSSSANKKPESDRIYVPKTRRCLMCSTEFQSSWPGERICKSCKETAAWKDSSLAA